MFIWLSTTTTAQSSSSSTTSSASYEDTFSTSSVWAGVQTVSKTYNHSKYTSFSGYTMTDGLWTSSEGQYTTNTFREQTTESDNTTLNIGSTTEIRRTTDCYSGSTTEVTGSSFSSSQHINNTGGITSNSGTTTTSTNGSTAKSSNYQLEETIITTSTSNRTTTTTSNSSYSIISASTTITTISNNTSITISTFTSTVSQTTKRTTTINSVINSTSISILATQNQILYSTYVTAVAAENNEILGIVIPSCSGPDKIINNFTTFTGTSTFIPIYNFVQEVTRILPTRTTTAVNFPFETSALSSSTHTRLSKSSISTTLVTSNTSQETITVAISSFLDPYTTTQTRRSTNYSILSSTITTDSFLFEIYGNTFQTTSTTSNTITITLMTHENNGTSSFTFLETKELGWITTTLSSAIRVFEGGGGGGLGSTDFAVHTGYSISKSSSSSYIQANTDQSITEFTQISSTFAAGKSFQTADSGTVSTSQIPTVYITIAGGATQIYLGAYYARSYINGTAFLAPKSDFATRTPGSNISPDIPSEFVIPATYKSRVDGPALPFPSNTSVTSTILTFLRNNTGGVGTTVPSESYTTFLWKFSHESLSITTLSNVNSTSTISSSTSAILNSAGDGYTHVYSIFLLGFTSTLSQVTSTRTRQVINIGGKQKATDASYIPVFLYNIGTVYPTNGDLSYTYTKLNTSPSTTTISSKTDYTVEQYVQYFYVKPGSLTDIQAAYIQTFERNRTRV